MKLLPIFRERVWGRKNLAPFYDETPRKEPIGEVWFTFEENFTSSGERLGNLLRRYPEILGDAADPRHPGVCPLLVKLLFTSERLSVQVHPDDEYAARNHDSLGKTEAWYVIDAQPPGEVAVGFRETLTPQTLKAAALSGEIERLLDWRRVSAGDVIFTPARTVHAIGAGLTVCEIQQNSDITYRLYDYGRPRELHLEHGVQVSNLGSHECEPNIVPLGHGRDELLACSYFRIERLRTTQSVSIPGPLRYYAIVICLKGTGQLERQPFGAGDAWLLPANANDVSITDGESEWILTYTGPEPMRGLRIDD